MIGNFVPHAEDYRSQRQDELGRIISRADKLRVRLGGEPGWRIPDPPKGMRKARYQRLLSALLEADMIANEAFENRVEQLEQMEERRRARGRRR